MDGKRVGKETMAAVAPPGLAWTLPYPHGVTANHLYRGSGRNRQLTPAHQAFRNNVLVIVRDGGMPRVPAGKLALLLDVYVPDETRRDLDNVIKGIQDSLAVALEIDDRRIDGIGAMRLVDRANPRIEVQLLPMSAWGPARARQWLTGGET